ncbi:MAG: murein biosynthesis integral membrane protein MurJ [Acidobacteria bacterium]|nr:murein biosynthesis integral membrane protein MurJ [Acidobacteriota bacterium]
MSASESIPGGSEPDPASGSAARSSATSSSHLARSAGVVGAATMTSRVLGLMREQVLAYWFGASDAMDAFLVAFRVPNLVRDLFAEGAMSAALVPTFSRTLANEGKARAWQLGNSVMNALVLVTGVFVVGAMVFAPTLIDWLAGDYASVPGKFELTVTLTRTMAPFLVLIAVAAACMGMLNSLNVFFIPALSPAMFNVASIVVGVGLVPVAITVGVQPILAMAIGTLVGGIGQVLLQWPPLRARGFRWSPRLDFSDPGLRRVLVLMGPGMVGLAATQLNVFVNTVVATGEGTGAVSWLGYAFRVMYLPIGLFGVSIATATTPALARLAAAADTPRMRSTLASAVALMLTLNVPATLGLVVLATPIVRILFERGSFGPADTAATAAAVQLYAIGLVGYSVVKILSPAFYALNRSRTPAAVGVAAVLLNAFLSVTTAPVFGYKGLAFSASIAALFNAATLAFLLRRSLGGLELARVAATFGKVLVAALVMSATAWWSEQWLGALAPGASLTAQSVRLGGAIAAAVTMLGVSAQLLGIREFEEVRDGVLRRVRGMFGRT